MPFSTAHDLHIHTRLSACCADETMTPQAILDYAVAHRYDCICITDHCWDAATPGASDWYRPQTIEHIRRSLPLPECPATPVRAEVASAAAFQKTRTAPADHAPCSPAKPATPVRFLFGCETEYCGEDRIGISRTAAEALDFLIVPLNHFHMEGFVRPASVQTPRAVAALFTERLEQLLRLDLPWSKVGLAHLTCPLLYTAGDVREVLTLLDPDRFLRLFEQVAARGAGIELNAGCFPNWNEAPALSLQLYRWAKRAGCRFYCGSDAHSRAALDSVGAILPEVARALELTGQDRFVPR